VSASSRYWEEDIVDPPITVSTAGTIAAPEKPGIGFDVNVARIERNTVRKETISAN
jgi:O-succinylbenzoate synthase